MDLKGLFIIFLVIIVGLALLGTVADKTYEATSLPVTNVTNVTHSWDFEDSIDVTAAESNWMLTDMNYYVSWESLRLTNNTFLVKDTDYTVTYDNQANTVTVHMLNTTDSIQVTFNANQTLAVYGDYPKEYVQGSAAPRTIIGFNTLWFALTIALFVLGTLFVYLKKNDLF